jgi:hypothetical protein
VSGAELAQGVSTVATTFTAPVRTVLIALDDPGSAGNPVTDRQLLLGLDGATRALDATGAERAPVLLTEDNRSVLAYDVVPDPSDADRIRKPVVVTVASRRDWSLVGVMGSASLDAAGAIALVAARGLDAVLDPLAPPPPAGSVAPASVLVWEGPGAHRRAARDRQGPRQRTRGARGAAARAVRHAQAGSTTTGAAAPSQGHGLTTHRSPCPRSATSSCIRT